MELPVYMITGFLESGKTSFILDTIQDKQFSKGQRTLIIACEEGEVDNSVFDRYIEPLYKEASYKPYIIAAMIFLSQVKDPARALMELDQGKEERKSF